MRFWKLATLLALASLPLLILKDAIVETQPPAPRPVPDPDQESIFDEELKAD